MLDHSHFLDAFTVALNGDASAVGGWLDGPNDAGLAVYRNTVACGAIDALAAAFPTVQTIVGEGWFRAAAKAFSADHPPCAASLVRYGAEFPDWVGAFPPAEDTPYLAHIAQFDRLWWEAHFAADAPLVDVEALAALEESDLSHVRLGLQPAVRLAASEETLISLWRAHQASQAPEEFVIEPKREWMLLSRPYLTVEIRPIGAAAYAFLAACAHGASLAHAAAQALDADPAVSFPAIVATGLEAGAFTGLEHIIEGRSA